MQDDAEQTDDAARAALERVAFGRPENRKGEKAARKAQKKLISGVGQEEAHPAEARPTDARPASTQQTAAATPPTGAPAAGEALPAAEIASPLTLDATQNASAAAVARTRTRPQYIAAIVIALVVGGIAGSGATQAIIQSRPIPASEIQPAPGHGNATAAEKYFEGVQTEVDNFPEPQWLKPLGIIESSTRAVQTSGSGAELWIGKTERDLCLMWTGNIKGTPSLETSCATPEAFARSGLTLVHGDEAYGWDGLTFKTTTNEN